MRMEFTEAFNSITLPHDELILSSQDTLRDRISKLQNLLDADLEPGNVLKVKYEVALYSKFLDENSHNFKLDNILASINDEPASIFVDNGIIDVKKEDSLEPVMITANATSTIEYSPALLSCTIMKSLSGQLYQELMPRFRSPTVIKVSANFIAFGTESASVLVFDFQQKLISILDPPLKFPVTALGISFSQNLMVSGHESGHLFVWDIWKKSIIKAIPSIPANMFHDRLDGHLASCSITHVTFIGQKDRFISADHNGNAFYHEVNQIILMYSINSTRIHNHPREHSLPTTIFNIKALPSRYLKSEEFRMVAITTPYKLMIMNMKPSPWIVFRFFWASNGQYATKTVPCSCISWLPINKGQIKLPKLAVSYGPKIIIFEISIKKDSLGLDVQSEISITITNEWEIHSNIVYMEWITESLILCFTNNATVVFSDAQEGKYLYIFFLTLREHATMENMEVAYTDCLAGSLTELGMECEYSYHQTICLYKQKLFCLGKNKTIIASILSWKDRLNILMDHGEYPRAFQMAESIYENKSLYVITGLPKDYAKREKSVGDFIESMVTKVIGNTSIFCEESDEQRLKNLEEKAHVLFSASVKIGRMQLIFSSLYDAFVNFHEIGLFNTVLGSFILKEDIVSIPYPAVMKSLISHYVQLQSFESLEAVLLKLDLKNLDIDYTLAICRKHAMFVAMIRIYNICLDDFIHPLNELATLLLNDINSSKLDILFNYLAFCITNRSFPDGTLIDDEKRLHIVFGCIKHLFSPNETVQDTEKIGGFAFLKSLLRLNVSKALQICELCLDRSHYLNNCQVEAKYISFLQIETSKTIDKGLMITVLLYLSHCGELTEEMPIIDLFIANMIVKHSLMLKIGRIKDLVSSLSISANAPNQDKIIGLLDFYLPYFIEEIDKLLLQYSELQFWKVYQFLGEKTRRYDLVLYAMLKDQEGHKLMESLKSLLTDPCLSNEERNTLKSCIYSSMETFLNLNIGIESLINYFWPFEHNIILDTLKPELQLLYLENLISDLECDENENIHCKGIYDKFINLQCELKPEKVKSTLSLGYNFTREEILDICKSQDIIDAVLYLLEEENQVSEAFDYIIHSNHKNFTLLISEGLSFLKRYKTQLSADQTLKFQNFLSSLVSHCAKDQNFNLTSVIDAMIRTSSFNILIQIIKYIPQSSQLREILNSVLPMLSFESEIYKILTNILEEESIKEMESLVNTRRKGILYKTH